MENKAVTNVVENTKSVNWEELWKSKSLELYQCPNCKTGTLERLAEMDPVREAQEHFDNHKIMNHETH